MKTPVSWKNIWLMGGVLSYYKAFYQKYFLDKVQSTVYTSIQAILVYLICIKVNNQTLFLIRTETKRMSALSRMAKGFLLHIQGWQKGCRL